VPALEACDVSMRRCGRSLLQRVSLAADRGEMLALCGPEGSGTRTLLHLLSGHLQADAGRVRVDGRERCPRRGAVGLDPRRLASGPDETTALLEAARRAADAGAAVVLSIDAPTLVARHASTLALFVAGRLLSWGAPAIALVPAFHILAAGGFVPAVGQAGSIITSST
jgi:Fe-S cluster assembly ATPase SufC